MASGKLHLLPYMVLLTCASCDRTAGSGSYNDGYAPVADDTPSAVAEDDAPSAVAESVAWGSPRLEVGKVSGDPSETFGRIRDVAVDDNGDILILDDQALMLHWFSGDGTHRGSAGRGGGGPGEFRAPVSIEFDGDGGVLVVDMAHRRGSVFSRSNVGLVLDTTFTIPIHALDACALGDRLFLLAPNDGLLIHETDRTGQLRNSFAAPAKVVSPEYARHASILTESYARGRLLCSESPPMIIVIHEHLPDVRAFSPEGTPIWSIQLRNYRRLQWGLFDEGRVLRMQGDPETGTAHTARYLARMSGDRVAVTLKESGLANPEGELSVRLLSMTSGAELGEWNTPVMVAGVHAGKWYGYRDLPYPSLLFADIVE